MVVISKIPKDNLDLDTVAGFGDEWSRFDQKGLDNLAQKQIFEDYFSVFPWDLISPGAVGMDAGCGSGRWAQIVAPRVGLLWMIDASIEALKVAKSNLAGVQNVRFKHASVNNLPMADESLDFAYSLGVLHHVPDTAKAIRSVADKLKSGAPFLVYLYYAFDNRGSAYRFLWRISDGLRCIVSRLPYVMRYLVSQVLALLAYWPLARIALALEHINLLPSFWPLAYYRDKPFYVLRTDALDRFGTKLEQRFTQAEILVMLQEAGFHKIHFSNKTPFWCAVGTKR